eukprot:11704059-Heterocapsa_arctica.AAC.1
MRKVEDFAALEPTTIIKRLNAIVSVAEELAQLVGSVFQVNNDFRINKLLITEGNSRRHLTNAR